MARGLFETKGNTLHLRALMEEIRALGTSPALVTEAEAALKALEATVKKVRIIRHNAVAHRSASVSHDAAYELANVTVDEVRDLVAHSEAVAKALARAAGVDPPEVAYFAAEALDRLFTDLGRLRERDRRRERESPRGHMPER